MDLLRIEHEDFIFTVESTRFEPMWQKVLESLSKESRLRQIH